MQIDKVEDPKVLFQKIQAFVKSKLEEGKKGGDWFNYRNEMRSIHAYNKPWFCCCKYSLLVLYNDNLTKISNKNK